jgi:hypothetical protein
MAVLLFHSLNMKMMRNKANKLKILVLLLVLTSLIGYTEWGNQQSMFIFQMEYELLTIAKENTTAFSHPLILLPLLGQFLLIYCLLVSDPNKVLIICGASAIFILLFVFFLVGLLTQKIKIISSALPFLTIYFYTLWYAKKTKN